MTDNLFRETDSILAGAMIKEMRARLDQAYPLDDDRDKTLRYWTANDFRQAADWLGDTANALAASIERAGVRTNVAELLTMK